MKRIVICFFLLPLSSILLAQQPSEIIAMVKKAQSQIRTITYQLRRTDTLVTGDVRTMTGTVQLIADNSDSIFGFRFNARKNGEQGESIYDGIAAYVLNTEAKTYTATTSINGIMNVIYRGGGGHVVFPDLVRLDTSKAAKFETEQDTRYYYLTIIYPDYAPENVIKRFKKFTIDKKTLLPVSLKHHQEHYGKVQDLNYEVSDIRINDPSFNYNFSSAVFLKGYQHELATGNPGKPPVQQLLNRDAPTFTLHTFDDDSVSLNDVKGKVLLLDLWELWCGPCITAMPKIDSMCKKYSAKGLRVYGVTNDMRALSAAKRMVKEKGLSITMLVGNEEFRDRYYTSTLALPTYILIDRSGKVVLISSGFSNELEQAVQKALL